MQFITDLIATYGYIVVSLVVLAESAGLPVPGETSLLLAAAIAASGRLSIVGVIAAAALGAILGDTLGYWIGRRYGFALIRRHGHLFRFDEVKRLKAEAFFARHGDKTVLLGRFVPVGRIFTAVLAGAGQMPYRRFLAWNAAGGILWATLMGTLGYLFGHQLPLVEQVVHRFGLVLLLALVAYVILRVVLAFRRRAAPADTPSQVESGHVRRGWAELGRQIHAGRHTLLGLLQRWTVGLQVAACCVLALGIGGTVILILL